MEGEKATVIDSAAEIEGKLHGKNVRILQRKRVLELQPILREREPLDEMLIRS